MQSSEIPSEKFDYIVVGSSPILMLYALRLRKEAKTVLLIEQSKTMGGAWSIDNFSIGLHNIKHENACHLIEWYSGGYELIEHISGVRFLPLNPQPIKVWRLGKKELYTSHKSILVGFLFSFRSVIFSVVKLGVSYLGIKKIRPEVGWAKLSHDFNRMMIEFRYRLSSIAEFNGIRSPEGGFPNFVHHLSEQLDLQKVEIIRGRADDLRLEADGSCSIAVGERKIHAINMVLGESSILGVNNQNDSKFNNYYHVLIATLASDTISRNAYVHYPDHSIFHRISYVEDTVDGDGIDIAVFLIQLRLPLEDIRDLRTAFDQIQDLHPIVKSSTYFKLLRYINSAHLSSSVDSIWYSFVGEAPFVLKTIGDLSRNILLMKHLFLNKKGE